MTTQAEKVAYWTTGYNLWTALPKPGDPPGTASDGEAQIFDDSPCLGFWRKPVHERNERGNNRRVGWKPLAIYMHNGVMVGRVGLGEHLEGESLVEIWSWVAKHPIREDWYRDVAENGKPWPDAKSDVPAADRDVSTGDNDPPEVLTDKDHAAAIDAAIGASLNKVTDEAQAAQALGSKNRIAELRLAADKAGKAFYDPPFREYKRLHGLWTPMVARADAAEKAINKAILTFREAERIRIAKEQAEADERQRLLDEANARAADRAIAAGEPEQPPVVEEVIAPAAPAPIIPTYGTRKIKEEVKTFLDTITDYDAVYAFLKTEPKVKELLLELATAKVKAGFTVPGTTTREGLI
jgi:hypothetical protein